MLVGQDYKGIASLYHEELIVCLLEKMQSFRLNSQSSSFFAIYENLRQLSAKCSLRTSIVVEPMHRSNEDVGLGAMAPSGNT